MITLEGWFLRVYHEMRADGFPTKMTITDKLQEGTTTTLVFSDLVFGVVIADDEFTTRWLERK